MWDWTVAALSSVYTLPAAGVALSDPQNGLALAVGVLPAAIAGLLPRPMFGVGLSYSDIGKAAGLAGLMVLGSVCACLVSAAFSTFLVFLLLLQSNPQTAAKHFDERVLETLLGVGIAYFYGLALPALARQRRN